MAMRALAAEAIGTFAFVLATCGAGLFAAPSGGGPLAVALAAGLSAAVMGYAIGPISGAHLNPAVTLGLIAGGRFDGGNAIGYILAQVAGAVAAAFLLQVILGGAMSAGPGVTTRWNDLAAVSNTYGGQRAFSMVATLALEVVATALLLVVVMGATAKHAVSEGLAPLAVGLALVVLYLVCVPVTSGSLNPARSTGPAIFAGGAPLAQLWVFWVAPIAGGIVGGAIGRWLDAA